MFTEQCTAIQLGAVIYLLCVSSLDLRIRKAGRVEKQDPTQPSIMLQK